MLDVIDRIGAEEQVRRNVAELMRFRKMTQAVGLVGLVGYAVVLWSWRTVVG